MSNTADDPKLFITNVRYPAEAVTAKTSAIYTTMLRESEHVRAGNFTVVSNRDLEKLFDLYDGSFFSGVLRSLVQRKAEGRLSFRLSGRMSRAGGKTIRHKHRTNGWLRYEIAVSTQLLFLTFGDAHRPITICGSVCADRLTALQRIVEHEMIHLAEMLVWDVSSCSARQFQSLACNIFGHTGVTHDLITPPERALTEFDIRVGDGVTFEFEGVPRAGTVNRIARRATVLVENEKGIPYSNGKRYLKFYVPLSMLTKRGVQA